MRKVTDPKAHPRRPGDLGRTQNVFLITFHAPRKGAPFKFCFKSFLLCWVVVHNWKALLIHFNFVVLGERMANARNAPLGLILYKIRTWTFL